MDEFNPSLKLLHFPDHLTALMNGDHTYPPVGVEISPTNHCPARCPWCFYVSGEYKQRHSREELPWEDLRLVLHDLAEMGVKAVTWTGGGDPCVYSYINEAIAEAQAVGLKQGMFTNGYQPIEEPWHLDWIRITVTEKYLLTRHVKDYVGHTKVGVNFNLCAENEPQMLAMLKQSLAMGVHYFQVRPALADRADLQQPVEMPLYLKEWEQSELPGVDGPGRTRIVLTEYKWDDYLKPHGYTVCHGHRLVPFLWHNGDVSTCAYHFGKEAFTLGNICNGVGFAKVWEGCGRKAKVTKGIPVVKDCQHCCKLHEANKVLALLNGDQCGPRPADLEFI